MSSREQILTSADGTKIWVESAGDPSKPAIVFIHGLACTPFGFDPQFSDEDLLKDFFLVRYEFRGHGRSGQPLNAKDYESIRFAEDFRAVCDVFGLKRPFLAGWSMGGCIAVDVINAYGPSYLSGIIYLGGVLSTSYIPDCIRATMRPRVEATFAESADAIARAAEGWVDSCVAAPLPYAVKLLWMGAFIAQARTARYLNVFRQQARERWVELARNVPVLIVQGTEDQVCDYEHVIETAKSVYADVEVVMLDGVGHSACVERPAETNRLIRSWVNKVAKNDI